MAQFKVYETQVVRYCAVYEADTAEEAEALFLDGEEPVSSRSDVESSYGLSVQPYQDR